MIADGKFMGMYLADLLIMLQRAVPLLGREGGMSEAFRRKRRKGEEAAL